MVDTIHIIVPGEPLTKSNAYFSVRGQARPFVPKRQKDYQEKVHDAAILSTQNHLNFQPFEGDIEVEIWYYLGSRRVKDLPNLPKTTCDALNDVVYKDDRQITDQHCYKRYDKENPRVEITVRELPENVF